MRSYNMKIVHIYVHLCICHIWMWFWCGLRLLFYPFIYFTAAATLTYHQSIYINRTMNIQYMCAFYDKYEKLQQFVVFLPLSGTNIILYNTSTYCVAMVIGADRLPFRYRPFAADKFFFSTSSSSLLLICRFV